VPAENFSQGGEKWKREKRNKTQKYKWGKRTTFTKKKANNGGEVNVILNKCSYSFLSSNQHQKEEKKTLPEHNKIPAQKVDGVGISRWCKTEGKGSHPHELHHVKKRRERKRKKTVPKGSSC